MANRQCEVILQWAEERLQRVLAKVVGHFHQDIQFGRYVMKNRLYNKLNWWYRFSKEDTLQTLDALSRIYPGIVFNNRGLFVPKGYLIRNANREPDAEQVE